jgi:ubiquinone/menaquinone biosynthesis C-methylase UbiE
MELSPTLYHWLVRPKWSTKKHIHHHIKEHINFENKIVLDFGSGTGANCTLCKPSHYYGIEPDLKRVEFAKRVYPNFTFHAFDKNNIPLDANSVDIILIVAVLHHIHPNQIEAYLKEFRRVLKPDVGNIIVMEPCFTNEKSIANWFMGRNDNGDYIQNEQGYLNVFKKNGFKSIVLKKYRKNFFYHEIFFLADYS